MTRSLEEMSVDVFLDGGASKLTDDGETWRNGLSRSHDIVRPVGWQCVWYGTCKKRAGGCSNIKMRNEMHLSALRSPLVPPHFVLPEHLRRNLPFPLTNCQSIEYLGSSISVYPSSSSKWPRPLCKLISLRYNFQLTRETVRWLQQSYCPKQRTSRRHHPENEDSHPYPRMTIRKDAV